MPRPRKSRSGRGYSRPRRRGRYLETVIPITTLAAGVTSVTDMLQNFPEAEREGATWKSFNGKLWVGSLGGTTPGQIFHYGIIPVELDADVAGVLPDPQGPDERGGASNWLVRRADVVSNESLTSGSEGTITNILRLFAMRKLHAGMVLDFIIHNPAGQSIKFMLTGRAYILLS